MSSTNNNQNANQNFSAALNLSLPTQKTQPRSNLTDLCIFIYGATKIGKTTLASQFPKPFFLSTEVGTSQLATYERAIPDWQHFLGYCSLLKSGKHEFETIVVDTVDIAYNYCRDYHCSKYGVTHESDMQWSKGWDLVSTEFAKVMNQLNALPYGLVLISHSEEKEVTTRTGKIQQVSPTVKARGKRICLAMADYVLYCNKELVDKIVDGKVQKQEERLIHTKTSTVYEAGSRNPYLQDPINLSYTDFIAAHNEAVRLRDEAMIRKAEKRAQIGQDVMEIKK